MVKNTGNTEFVSVRAYLLAHPRPKTTVISSDEFDARVVEHMRDFGRCEDAYAIAHSWVEQNYSVAPLVRAACR